jgi:hypothetical protein
MNVHVLYEVVALIVIIQYILPESHLDGTYRENNSLR